MRRVLQVYTEPSRDFWGLSDLWEITDPHFCRPNEGLGEAMARWVVFLAGKAAAASVRFIVIGLIGLAAALVIELAKTL